MDANTLVDLIQRRRTPNPAIFVDKTIPRDVLIECIDFARYAPNHMKTEPARFYLATADQKKKLGQLFYDQILQTKGIEHIELAEKKRAVWSRTPELLVVTSFSPKDSKTAAKRPEIHKEDYATVSVIIQNLTLLLLQKHIHIKWSTAAVKDKEDFRKVVGINASAENEEVVGILLMGYLPDDHPFSIRPLLPLDEVFRS